jgi:glycosyltransferase involved in cell wall biosynthesis
MPLPADAARSLELIYALSRHPQRISTFVNGEAAVLAGQVGRLRIVAEKRSAEPDIHPGGIPPEVDVQWTPKRRQASFWLGSARWLRSPGRYLAELRDVMTPAAGFTAKRRWGYSVAAAAAYAARLPEWSGQRHVHAHFAATGAIIAQAIARVRRIPYSVTVHGSADLFRENPHLDLLLSEAAFVAAVSDYHRNAILERLPHLDPSRVRVIHVGVPTRRLIDAAGPITIRDSGDARIVSVANLVAFKGMPILIDAVGRLVDAGQRVSLDILGDGPLRGGLAAQIERLDLADRVHLRGVVSPEEAHAAMREADLVALASIRTPEGAQDGVPTVLMEAMATGRPVVSTRLSGIPELIEDGRTGWLAAPGDAGAFADAIIDALTHPEEAARRARAARGHVEEHFDQERNALALLDAILAARPPQKASR